MKENLNRYAERLSGYKMICGAPMSDYTSFSIGGPADLMVMPRSRGELAESIAAAKELKVPWHVIGNGTNLLVSDEGVEGVVIRIAGDFSGIEYHGNFQRVLAGTLMSAAVKDALDHGFMGMEWAGGIPGTVGGAAAMNAGAYGGEMKQALRRLECISDGMIAEIIPRGDDMGYRRSRFCAPDMVTVSAEFELAPDDGGARERLQEYGERRRSRQPLAYHSAGSTFKRPAGHFAGALIEQAGLKGFRIGGAEVSTLHAGFIINRGGASCADVKELMRHVQRAVYEHSGIMLQPEVKFIGR